ncbi:hypothetical protein CHLNCDRAFT_133072 [Chlorella variabilis]|uniref:Uncharacterized protein n=1 Tax=Chlorella variabilis TaxID=554065 RepID=E1Z2A4_CHLVA|nr:hypothetical protein CHLNCDRAFT_133072 [Chlorella variabilis]EFN59966.1 hypothetical protein CHLNCDRAFT_133072 [Chlorella variabilis]|eukprot:XP_005852068.1 hypothetical protein CHLNCDRAFT_133072 [Chlorella variabilis]
MNATALCARSSAGVQLQQNATSATALSARSFAGVQLQQDARSLRVNKRAVCSAASKKMNSYDENWDKGDCCALGYAAFPPPPPVMPMLLACFGFGTIGLFAEDREKSSVNIFKQVEKKKLLSTVEKAGLLTAAEKAGLSLGKIEKLGLLSTAERLGLLTLAEDLLTTDPGKISSASLPCFVAAIAALVFIPQDNALESVLAYTLSLGAGGLGAVLFIGGFLVKGLQDE